MIYPSSFVEHCKKDHCLPDICCPDPGYDFTIEEIKILYEYFKHEYISYENPELLSTVRKISRIVNDIMA